MINHRLNENHIPDLLDLIGKRYPLTVDIARIICSGQDPAAPCTQVYGVYEEKELVSVMTATYSILFPHDDGTRVVHISGAYTKEDMRHKGYAAKLLGSIEYDAVTFFNADYLCCDSTADGLYISNGFVNPPAGESRLWKPLGSGGQ